MPFRIFDKLVHSSYLAPALTHEGLRKRVDVIVRRLRPISGRFDAIAYRGMSGALVAPAVALRLKKDLIFVRKNESCHTNMKVEGVECKRYVIVDDMVSSGTTVRTIKEKIEESKLGAKMVGLAVYLTTSDEDAKYLANTFEVWVVTDSKNSPFYPRSPVGVVKKRRAKVSA
jgi:adenine/guanine phosphoribosyltransferase-like PRPP-binding protein